MNNKKLEDMIRNAIDMDFEDISDKLTEYNYINKSISKKKMPVKLCISLCTIIILISLSFYYINITSNIKNFDDKENNIVYVNEINYKNLSGTISLEIENNLNKSSISLDELTKKINYNFNIKGAEISTIYCKNNLSNNEEIEQYEITYKYDSDFIYVNIKSNAYPTFSTETIDSWKENIDNKSIKVSKINNKELTIIQNLDNNKFISEYYDDNVNNYRTKIIINSVGFSFESYNLDFDKFVFFIENFIK